MFSGYGGAEFALKKANIHFECVGYSEIDKNAIKCYELNHPNIRNFGDCTKINTEELPDFDLLTGGFPCQDVSIAGNRDLSKGRTNLYSEILRIAKAKKPRYMLLENVRGLLSMGKKNKADDDLLINRIVRDLKEIGYGVCWDVLNSKDYGIPQNRERVWIVCKYGGWKFGEFEIPLKQKLSISLKDLLEKDVDVKYNMSEKALKLIKERIGTNYACKFNPEITNTLRTNYSNSFSNETYIIQRGRGKNKGGRKELCPTISSNNFEHNNHIYDQGMFRRLTPKECFRLMGFVKDEIKTDGISDSALYKLAGNGWEINVVSLILKQMFK